MITPSLSSFTCAFVFKLFICAFCEWCYVSVFWMKKNFCPLAFISTFSNYARKISLSFNDWNRQRNFFWERMKTPFKKLRLFRGNIYSCLYFIVNGFGVRQVNTHSILHSPYFTMSMNAVWFHCSVFFSILSVSVE